MIPARMQWDAAKTLHDLELFAFPAEVPTCQCCESPQALKWDDRLADACGCEGIVLRDDESDGTAQVRF